MIHFLLSWLTIGCYTACTHNVLDVFSEWKVGRRSWCYFLQSNSNYGYVYVVVVHCVFEKVNWGKSWYRIKRVVPLLLDIKLSGHVVSDEDQRWSLSRIFIYSTIMATRIKTYCCLPWSHCASHRHWLVRSRRKLRRYENKPKVFIWWWAVII